MWTRAELKDRAKACLRQYYWKAFLVTLIVTLLTGGCSAGGSGARVSRQKRTQEPTYLSEIIDGDFGGYNNGVVADNHNTMISGLIAVFMAVYAVVLAIAFLFKFFIGNPIIVGSKRFFMESRLIRESAGVGKVFSAFSNGSYLNVVKTMFLRDLFIGLWTLLLVIPGIIKAYQYHMVPYILSENPDMNYKEALQLSKQMMDGNKMDLFVLELSFLGWRLLGALACGVGTVFVLPYEEATHAELYAVLRNNVGRVGLRGFGISETDGYDDIVSEQ